MKHYGRYGYEDFVIALGYKGEYIKRYMVEYASLHGDVTVSMREGRIVHRNGYGSGGSGPEDWTVAMVDTGQDTATGGRIKRLEKAIGRERFMLTWGDGVSNIDLDKLLAFHESHGKLATLTAVRPPARFGHLDLAGNQITEFSEKPQLGEGWINGAFFVLEPEVFDYIEGDETQFEKEPLERLAADGELMAYRHDDFWQCMDTLRDKKLLEELWQNGAPWRTWS
jgi:glucose-1-phosphate cytidylyltransferase